MTGKVCINFFRVLTAVNHLADSALHWYITRFPKNPSWSHVKSAFAEEFCPTDKLEVRSAGAKYNGLSQGNRPVEAYICEFEKYKSVLPANYELKNATRDRFVQNLKPSLRNKVFQSRPETLAEAKFLARDLERNYNFYKGPQNQAFKEPDQFFKEPYDLENQGEPYKNHGEPMDVDILRANLSDYCPQAIQCATNYNYNNNGYNNNGYNRRGYNNRGRNYNGSNNGKYNNHFYRNRHHNNTNYNRSQP